MASEHAKERVQRVLDATPAGSWDVATRIADCAGVSRRGVGHTLIALERQGHVRREVVNEAGVLVSYWQRVEFPRDSEGGSES